MTTKRREFSPEFKREAAQLVLDQSYSISQASESLGVGTTALRRWVKQLTQERQGFTPKTKALTQEQQQIQSLEKRIKRLELEKKILKKATVDSSEQRNSYTKKLICRRAFDETSKAHLYPKRERLSL
jgi:transposase